jgi:uncharacterized protein YraI/beta-lactamase class A
MMRTLMPDKLSRMALLRIASMVVLGAILFGATLPGLAQTDVRVEAIDWVYVRYGPGLNYPRIGIIEKGSQYIARRRDTNALWLEIDFPAFAGGRGWVFIQAVSVTGNPNLLPTTSEATFTYPLLTATPLMVVTSAPVWTVTPISVLRDHLGDLGNSLYKYLLSRGFEPGTQKVGAVFLMDLQTGERYTITPGLAFSGMSLIKIPILVSLYRKIDAIPSVNQAELIGLMIVCSENASADELLSFLGDGDALRGAGYVTETLHQLGLQDAFLQAPLVVAAPGPTPTLPPIGTLKTSADQVSTHPDPYNQVTAPDLGWLLADVYQCAMNGTGPLLGVFGSVFTEQKCRGILRALEADDIPAMIRAGVPSGIQVAHKHGWVNEVHGDAGIVLTPGGDYVLVVLLRNRAWLDYQDSFPTIAEISRMIYNRFNPANVLAQSHTQPVPQCSLSTLDPQLVPDLRSGQLPPPRD